MTVLINSGTITVTATNPQPANSAGQIQWQMGRDPTDTVDAAIPAVGGAPGAQATFQPSAAGNFRLVAYIDLNGNGMFDEGEQLGVLRFAVVRATLQPGSRFQISNTLTPTFGVLTVGAATQTSSSNPFPMALLAFYLLEGGGANRTIGTPAVTIGNVGNLVSDTFAIAYPVPDPAPGPPGNVPGTGTENPGGPTPMVDTGIVAAGAQPSGGATAFRTYSTPAPVGQLPAIPATGGAMADVLSADAPFWNWRQTHPETYNNWASTNGSISFQEFIAAFSTSFPSTYVALNQAGWTVTVVGTSNNSRWQNSGSSITGDTGIQSVSAAVQVLGLSYARQNQIVYQP
jgi:hypothetical protein